MGICKRMLRKVGTWAVLGGLGASGVWLAGAARGQGPAPSAAQDAQKKTKIYTNKNLFHLPVQIDPRTRGNLREVCLYVKTGSADWVRQETGQPNATHFSYRATQDGEYWFSVVTIDRNGRSNPADVAQEPPGLQVVVDTQEPGLDLQPVALAGETLLRAGMQDANPDLATLKIVYRGTDQMDHIVEPIAGRPGFFRVPTDAWNRPVLLKGVDRCGNAAVREFQIRNPQVARQAPAAPAPLPGAIMPEAPLTSTPTEQVMPTSFKNDVPAAAKTAASREPGPLPKAVEITPRTMEAPRTMEVSMPPPITPPAPFPPSAFPPATKADSLPSPASMPPSADPFGSAAKAFAPHSAGGPRQLLNTTKAALEYRIDQVGPSGVGKVEVFMTSDQGTSWQRLTEDADRTSPAEINLPGEGVFGIRLIVTNGNGFGGTLPKKGDAPSSYIEVDTTAPFVQLKDIEPNSKDGCLEIRWKASDKNLGPEPVNLYYRVRHDAAWVPIAKRIRNEGVYMWSFPRDCGNRFFVKIEVNDQAGNIANVECPNPVVLDMTEPRASVVGISGIMVRPASHDQP